MQPTCPVRNYPFGEAQRLDVDPAYAELRESEPLSRIQMPYGGEAWLATRHADVKTVLSDPRFSRAAVLGTDVPRIRPEVPDRPGSILTMDPPEHSRLRKLVAKAFTGRRVEKLRPRAQEITDGLLDGMLDAGAPGDLVTHLSVPLPVTLICELLGVPVTDRDIFRAGADAALSTSSMTPEERTTARQDLNGYLAGLVAERRAQHNPADDLLGALVTARDEGDRLSEDEMVELGTGILVAGHETTMNQISNMAWTLLSDPRRWARLRENPENIAQEIEELLRFVPLGTSAEFPRIATEDIELGGVLVRAGEPVVAAVHAANRDPNVFDEPDTLNAGRQTNPHVAFGHGPHHCLGAQLARMELQVAFATLTRRFPTLALAGPAEDVVWKSGVLVRGPRELMVSWTDDS